jgi:aryl-alcohol dehydrogenase-like predicted oxidoreductase
MGPSCAPKQRREASLAQLLLWNLSSLPGISAVLLGAHSLAHVSQALATLAWPAAATPEATLRAARSNLQLTSEVAQA